MKLILNSLILGLTLALPVWAETQPASHGMAADHAATLSQGVVKKVDKSAGKMTIKHGPLENLGMPGMTMVFRVQDASWLDKVKPGDNIRFHADTVKGALTVTELETVQ